jgi:hypothetical protein
LKDRLTSFASDRRGITSLCRLSFSLVQSRSVSFMSEQCCER